MRTNELQSPYLLLSGLFITNYQKQRGSVGFIVDFVNIACQDGLF